MKIPFNIPLKELDEWLKELDTADDTESQFKVEIEHESTALQGRAAILDYSSDNIIKQHGPFIDPQKLENKLKSYGDTKSVRLLIILEDLAPAWVKMLGPYLGIPPSVFALHWANPVGHMLGDVRVPLGQNPSRGFILNYKQIHPVKIEMNPGYSYKINRHAYRELDVSLERKELRDKRYETSEQLVSYWGTWLEREDDNTEIEVTEVTRKSWIAVLLVDPLPVLSPDNLKRELKILPSNSSLKSERGKLPPIPALSNTTGLPVTRENDSGEVVGGVNSNEWKPMFDDLLAPHQARATSPVSATHRCQRLVLARNVVITQQVASETAALTVESALGVQKLADIDFNNFEQKAWTVDWKRSIFTRLWMHRQNVEHSLFALQRNIKTIRRLAKSQDNNVDDDDYLQEWGDLEALLEYTVRGVKRTTGSYLQTVAASDAQFANIQARSVSRLTKLVTIFVPASLSAAVLTIPGFNGDGNTRALWIFWLVSVPLIIIIALLLYTKFGEWVQNRWNKYQEAKLEFKLRQNVESLTSSV